MTRRWRDPVAADRSRFDPADVFEAGLRNHHVSNTAYPIAHETTWRPYRVPRPDDEIVARAAWQGVSDLSLYVHVPFCEVRCSFCEYTVTGRDEHADATAHVDDMLWEMDAWAAALGREPRLFHGFDIGGGTPMFLPAEQIARIVERARQYFRFAPGADISIETTPRVAAAEPARLAAVRALGIERISMGIQVVEPDLLRVLGRSGNGGSEQRAAVENIRRAGFDRLNVDLMYGFAGQSEESWRATLQHAIDLGPEYITLYRMRYKLTRISHHAPKVTLDDVRPLARLAKTMLADAGFFATCGKTTWSRLPDDVGTSSYLARRVTDGLPYLGIGLGAQTLSPTSISYNAGSATKSLAPYAAAVREGRLPLQDVYDLPLEHCAGKMCAVSFYFGEIDRAAFARRFGRALEDHFPAEVAFVTDRGLMEMTPRSLRLTPRGADNVNGVIALFFAPSIQSTLLRRDANSASDFTRQRRAAVAVAGAEAETTAAAAGEP